MGENSTFCVRVGAICGFRHPWGSWNVALKDKGILAEWDLMNQQNVRGKFSLGGRELSQSTSNYIYYAQVRLTPFLTKEESV